MCCLIGTQHFTQICRESEKEREKKRSGTSSYLFISRVEIDFVHPHKMTGIRSKWNAMASLLARSIYQFALTFNEGNKINVTHFFGCLWIPLWCVVFVRSNGPNEKPNHLYDTFCSSVYVLLFARSLGALFPLSEKMSGGR